MTLKPTTFALAIHDGVAEVTLNRPERLNALTFEVYEELANTFASLDTPSVRAVIVTGSGKGFCSGGDVEGIIAELFAKDAAGLLAFTRATGRLIQNIVQLRRPVIAAVNGVAVGAGAVISIACDMRIAATKARFGFIFPKVGLCGADMGAAFLLPRIVGRGRADELLYFGDLIDAPTALSMGLVNRVVDDALATAQQWAKRLADGPAFAHAMTAQMLEAEHGMTLAAAIDAEAQAQAICMAHPDFRTAYDANRAKHKPHFQGAPRTSSGEDDA